MLNKVRIDKRYNWFNLKYFHNNIFIKTNYVNLEKFKNFFKTKDKLNPKIFKNFIKSLDFYFGVIIENKKNIFCAVDHVRSQPIFFDENCYISNSVKLLKKNNKPDKNSILEFKMLGYVTDNRTLIQNVYQINSGNIICWRKNNNKGIKINYFKYIPTYLKKKKYKEFDLLLNKIFQKIIKKAKNKTIIVFLSGGLDSRLVLSKLVELKYKKILAVSYGIKNNHDSIKAKEVCKILNIPWIFYEHDKNKIEELYKSNERVNYSNYSSNFCSTPSYVEFETLSKMNKDNMLKNKIIINGQSGDYISGSHLTKFINNSRDIKKNNFYKYIIKKHYSLWNNLINKKNCEFVEKRINESINKLKLKKEKKQFFSLYEYWEWKERQSKLVINGNKVYDFFNVEWEMPLWDKEIMIFFKEMNLNNKLNQKFYIDFLKKKNFKNIFNNLRSNPEVWVGAYKIIKYIGFLLNLFPLKKLKKNFYKKMYYYITDSNQYRMLGKENYFNNYRNSRNSISLFSKYYLKENNLE